MGNRNIYHLLTVFGNDSILDQYIFKTCEAIITIDKNLQNDNNHFLTDIDSIKATTNPLLLQGFHYFLQTLKGKVKAKEKLFKKDDYKSMKDNLLREQYLQRFKEIIQNTMNLNLLNDGTNVVPLYYATTEEKALEICQNGFVGSTEENGYYGKGVYFTSDFAYCKRYAPVENRKKCILVSMVALGNPFPLTEHPFLDENGAHFKTDRDGEDVLIPNPLGYYRKAERTGYQSHFILVSKTEPSNAFPIRGDYDPDYHSDSIVVFQELQAVPIFVMTFFHRPEPEEEAREPENI